MHGGKDLSAYSLTARGAGWTVVTSRKSCSIVSELILHAHDVIDKW